MKIETIIVAILGAASGILGGILGYIKFFAERRDKKKAEALKTIIKSEVSPMHADLMETRKELATIREENSVLKSELHEIRLDTTRTQLLMLIEHQPHNHDTIMKVAHFYICELHGDWYCTALLKEWAKKENFVMPAAITEVVEKEELNQSMI